METYLKMYALMLVIFVCMMYENFAVWSSHECKMWTEKLAQEAILLMYYGTSNDDKKVESKNNF